MTVAVPDSVVTLEFDPAQVTIGQDTDLRQGLSAVVLRDGDLWLACDEGCRIERLSRAGTGFNGHTMFALKNLLTLPAAETEEADVEGLDVSDGFLWLVGSHSVKRKKPADDDAPAKVADKLKKLARDGNRHLLARIPIDGHALKANGSRKAGSIGTSATSSALLDAITSQHDPHLAPFIDLPGKDNGLDIEGLAVRDMRAFVGLRGPVLREWCCILELTLEADASGALRLMPLDGTVPYRKHFLKLHGLGIRDLAFLGDDLLILAGPSMAHDGPIEIWRWKNAATGGAPTPTPLLSLPHGEGNDRAEGLTVMDQGTGGSPSVLVVFDSPSPGRLVGPNAVRADVYRLP
jgi:Protein of unknown function (DUF3616)